MPKLSAVTASVFFCKTISLYLAGLMTYNSIEMSILQLIQPTLVADGVSVAGGAMEGWQML